MRAGVGNATYTIAKEEYNPGYVVVKTEGSATYVAIDFVKEYTDFDYSVH